MIFSTGFFYLDKIIYLQDFYKLFLGCELCDFVVFSAQGRAALATGIGWCVASRCRVSS